MRRDELSLKEGPVDMRTKFLFLFFFIFLSLSIFSFSEEKKDTTSFGYRFKNSKFIKKLSKERSFLIAPQLDHSPETGFLSGLYYLQLFKLAKDTDLRTSNEEVTLSYTQKKQFIVEFNNTLLFKDENYILRGTETFKRFNEYFYGIGNDTKESDAELMSYDVYQIFQRLTRRINAHNYAGVQYQYYELNNVSFKPDVLIDRSTMLGTTGSKTSGLGFLYLYDSRDNVINSFKGFYLDISNFINSKELGSQYNFHNFTLDARKFIQLWPSNILALQTVVNFNKGDVPFRQMANMGGDIMMRGYYYGRFRSNDMITTQIEYRLPIWRFIGMVVFGSAGEVAGHYQNFNVTGIHFGYGAGIRLMFIKHERVNVGIDFGFGKKTNGVYLGSEESF